MKLEVLTAQWAHDGGVLAGGVHDVERPSKKLLRAAAAAEHAGVVKVTASKDERAVMNSAVQSQSDGEKALAAAMESGGWHEGQRIQYELDRAAGAPTGDVG